MMSAFGTQNDNETIYIHQLKFIMSIRSERNEQSKHVRLTCFSYRERLLLNDIFALKPDQKTNKISIILTHYIVK